MTSTTPDSNLRVPTNPRLRHQFQRREDLADIPVKGGMRDRMSIPEVLAVLPPYTNKTNATTSRHARKKGSERTARIILEWLDNHPGTGWQEKWISSGSDTDLAWLDALTDPDDPRQEKGKRDEMKRGLVRLFLGRIVFPGYGFLSNYQATNLYSIARAAFRPDLFARFEERADALAANANQRKQAMVVATQIVLHTGRDLHELNSNDLLAYRAWHFLHRGSNPRTAHLAWSALVGIADLDGHQNPGYGDSPRSAQD